MAEVLLGFKDLEYLLRKQIPDAKFERWTDKGVMISLNFGQLGAISDIWQNVTIYKFSKIKLPKEVTFKVRGQSIDGQLHYQLCID